MGLAYGSDVNDRTEHEAAEIPRTVAFRNAVNAAVTIEELSEIDLDHRWKDIHTNDLLAYYAKQESLMMKRVVEIKIPEQILQVHFLFSKTLRSWSKPVYDALGEKAKEIYTHWTPPGSGGGSYIQD